MHAIEAWQPSSLENGTIDSKMYIVLCSCSCSYRYYKVFWFLILAYFVHLHLPNFKFEIIEYIANVVYSFICFAIYVSLVEKSCCRV